MMTVPALGTTNLGGYNRTNATNPADGDNGTPLRNPCRNGTWFLWPRRPSRWPQSWRVTYEAFPRAKLGYARAVRRQESSSLLFSRPEGGNAQPRSSLRESARGLTLLALGDAIESLSRSGSGGENCQQDEVPDIGSLAGSCRSCRGLKMFSWSLKDHKFCRLLSLWDAFAPRIAPQRCRIEPRTQSGHHKQHIGPIEYCCHDKP